VLEARRRDTIPHRGGKEVLDDAVALADGLAAGRPAVIGVGVCEVVDPGVTVRSAATIDWRDVDVPAAFAHLGPAVLEADVRAAALAEARIGAGRTYRSFVYLTVGTGVSYSLVVDGEPYAGESGQAIIVGAPPVENVASGRALAERSGLRTAEEVLRSPAHTALVAEAATELGRALAVLVNALDPAAVVIGGGLGLATAYRVAVVAAARAAIEHDNRDTLPMRPAACGSEAGAIGAALAAWNRTRPRSAVGDPGSE
jgi:predicted NBD/HSP70 family sugar kinase